jgi:hypothetical protein
MVPVAFWTEVIWAVELCLCVAQVEVYLFLCFTIVSVNSLGCHFDKAGMRPVVFDKSSLSVYLLPDSPFYIPETQAPSSSVIVLRPKVS